jgi:hypothetical protein
LEKSTLLTPNNRELTEEKLACLYLMSNGFKLGQYEQSIITNAQDIHLKRHLYSMYRHGILGKLADLPQEQSRVEFLIMNDGFITQQERQKLIRKRLPTQESGSSEKDIIQAANDLLSQGRAL